LGELIRTQKKTLELEIPVDRNGWVRSPEPKTVGGGQGKTDPDEQKWWEGPKKVYKKDKNAPGSDTPPTKATTNGGYRKSLNNPMTEKVVSRSDKK